MSLQTALLAMAAVGTLLVLAVVAATAGFMLHLTRGWRDSA